MVGAWSGSAGGSSIGRRLGRSNRSWHRERIGLALPCDLTVTVGGSAATNRPGQSSLTGSRWSSARPTPARSASTRSTRRSGRGCVTPSPIATRPSVLHLFASTGATTLALARAGARVTHVDGSRPTVAWARHNAELSGLADRPIRWIVDDALTFTRREARRGRHYDGIVLDPPSYGHGPRGERWELPTALPELLEAAAAVATDDAFVLLTAHATGLEPEDLGDALADAFGAAGGRSPRTGLSWCATSGVVLPLGVAARMIRG